MVQVAKRKLFRYLTSSARIAKGLSLRKLSEIVKIPHPTLSKYENGHSLPSNDDVIQRLADALDLDVTALRDSVSFERTDSTSLDSLYPFAHSLIKNIVSVMDVQDRNLTFEFFERSVLFKEDETQLAINFAQFLLGELGLNDLPQNRLRPLYHYFSPWCPEIERWDTENHEADPEYMVKEKVAVYGVLPFTQIQINFIEQLVDSKIEEIKQNE